MAQFTVCKLHKLQIDRKTGKCIACMSPVERMKHKKNGVKKVAK